LELNGIVLMGVGCGVRAGDGNVDRVVHRDGSVDRGPDEVAVAAVAGSIPASRDHIQSHRPVNADVAANCSIIIAAGTADARDLARRLVDRRAVRLMGVGCRLRAGLCRIERLKRRVSAIDQASDKIAVPAISGTVAARVDQRDRK
jgi:hypothetical protein